MKTSILSRKSWDLWSQLRWFHLRTFFYELLLSGMKWSLSVAPPCLFNCAAFFFCSAAVFVERLIDCCSTVAGVSFLHFGPRSRDSKLQCQCCQCLLLWGISIDGTQLLRETFIWRMGETRAGLNNWCDIVSPRWDLGWMYSTPQEEDVVVNVDMIFAILPLLPCLLWPLLGESLVLTAPSTQ